MVPAAAGSSAAAQYPWDPYDPARGKSASTDWEPRGYDHVMEEPAPATGGPFPLVVFSDGWGVDNWAYLFIGARLASHGFVVAIVDHASEGQWSSVRKDLLHSAVDRVHDIPFAITALLQKNDAAAELLHGLIDPGKIAVAGHSLGGYTALALAAGDESLCDTRFAYLRDPEEPWPYPADTCVPAAPDARIKAIISLDGTSNMLRWQELARIAVPSLIMGQTVGGIGAWSGRPHAAIGRPDSYRVDMPNAAHVSFTSWCDGALVASVAGLISAADVDSARAANGCIGTLAPDLSNQVVTTYMIAFLEKHLVGTNAYDRILTAQYAGSHQPLRERDLRGAEARRLLHLPGRPARGRLPRRRTRPA